jgi:phospholipid/cholesterol/gamma-HCH transport system substrate-binding protein
MSNPRVEIKVGVFMLICLGLLALLLIQFSKGALFFRPTKTIILRSSTVGGLRSRAQVLMSGVQVGTVAETKLSPEGTNVFIYVKIYNEYQVRSDARFLIEQSGLLGDPYVAIDPGLCKGEFLTNNSTAVALEPFNLLEVARSASGFVQRLDETAKNLNEAINDIRRTVLNEHTLTNLAASVENMKRVTEDAILTVDNINVLINSNNIPVGVAVSNLVVFSQQLNDFARSAQDMLATNGPEIHAAIDNIRSMTVSLTNVMSEIQAGKGVVGGLVRNQAMADDFSHIAANFSIMSSNLNRLGFWHWIWHKEVPPATNAPATKGKGK